ncbi:hypothetical protein KKE19_02750, partial [Patescibacteria group bacterium]|nr:hypothetical protein [Patescibacteria group bacterium]
EQIENPAGYNYQKALQSMKIAVSLNHVLLLKLEDSYAAIKPLEIGPKGTWIDFEWKSWSAIENKIATKSP